MKPDDLTQALIRGDWLRAEAILAPLAAAPGAHPSAVYNLGKVLMELGRHDEAIHHFRRCSGVAPAHQAAWFEMGRCALLTEDFPLALEAFSHALALDPHDSDARRNLGRVALRLCAWNIAREAWEPLSGDPEAALALYRVAAETRDPAAPAMRARLLADHPDRAAAIRTLVRVAKGAVPLDL